MTKTLMTILFTMILTENYVLVKFLGICPFLGVSKKLSSAVGMSLAVIFVMVIASAATYGIYAGLLVPLGLTYMRTIVFILVIAALVQIVEFALKKYVPALYRTLGIYLPLITTNCAVLGVTVLNVDNSYGFLESVVCGFGAGVGFLLAMVLFAGVRRTLLRAQPPKAFEGLPITLVSASLVSLTFTGFTGLVENLIG
ncbi:MAG: RnfABCDGE type electron transport complex subunit A [Oscillospiraceae bacterium]|nr:RnfABCDGE type electron transport complex subunit A [Oscillospiraceae bacterium]